MKKKRPSRAKRADAVALNVADRIEGFRAASNLGGGTDLDGAWELLDAAVSALVLAAKSLRYHRNRAERLSRAVRDA